MLYANTIPFYMRNLSIVGFSAGVGGPGTNPLQIPKEGCTDQFTHEVTEPESVSVLSKYLDEQQREGLVSCLNYSMLKIKCLESSL